MSQESFNKADMRICAKKRKAIAGPNKGLAYDPNNPCAPQYSWDPEKLECVFTG